MSRVCGYVDPVRHVGCQFDFFSAPDISLSSNGRWLCPFHKPSADKSTWSVVAINGMKERFLGLIDECEAKPKSELVQYWGVVFPFTLDFSKKHFKNGYMFRDATFMQGATFSDAHLESLTIDGECTGTLILTNLQIASSLNLMRVHCGRNVDISHLKAKILNLTICNFDFDVMMQDAFIEQNATFIRSKFGRTLDISNFKNNGKTGFLSTEFHGELIMTNAQFADFADFSYEQSLGSLWGTSQPNSLYRVLASNARFENGVCFTNRKFLDRTDFSKCYFGKAPEFFECELHQDTDFSEAEFVDHAPEARRAYRALKLAMEEVRARLEEGAFFVHEQKCIRNDPQVNAWTRFLSWAYDGSSEYGQDTLKPLIVLGLIFLNGWAAFLILSEISRPTIGLQDNTLSAGLYALEQLVRPLSAWGASPEDVASLDYLFSKNHFLARLVSLIQGVLELSTIAIFLFSLRWRFKRG